MSYTNDNYLIIYNHKTGTFTYPDKVLEQTPDEARPYYDILLEEGIMKSDDVSFFKSKLIEVATADKQEMYFDEYLLDNKVETKWFRIGIISIVPRELIHIVVVDIDEEKQSHEAMKRQQKRDELTGLYNRTGFEDMVNKLRHTEPGTYALLYLDVIHFKVINELFGIAEGNKVLQYIADSLRKCVPKDEPIGRLHSDRFVIFTHVTGAELERMVHNILNTVSNYELETKVLGNIGIYVTEENKLSVNSMIDRANMALSAIKGSFSKKYNFFVDKLRSELISEQEIISIMVNALAQKQFILHYQPKYDHSTGMLVSAEALVRWQHPTVGIISPGVFIPIFEKNGFITKLDYYVFEEVCKFLRMCMDNNLPLIAISVNFSRNDIFQPDFVSRLERIREKYKVSAKLLHVEITESAVVGNSKKANEIIRNLHKYGYMVEMDDFGSGYSSLNVLREIDFDVIKLDMLFMSNEPGNNRGGTILSSIVRMAKWLGMPVIAEGVETVTQADFLRSIGCNYIQGYLYSRPLPEKEYIERLSSSVLGEMIPQLRLDERLNACDFWDPNSLETLIFSNYVGAAAIFTYDEGKLEVLKVNQKYLEELSMNLCEKELIESDPWTYFDETNKKIYEDMIDRAILSGEEEECENWRTISSSCCGEEKFCIRSTVRVIGKSGECYLFHAMIRNITAEKQRYITMVDMEKRFMSAADQANMFFWEYTIATKEMRPCYRCMKVLGYPPLLRNYPDSAFEMGMFQTEDFDLYRDWHNQLAEGVESLEGVFELTGGRVPFIIRYTNEFDENGRPIKSYGSATLVVETNPTR